MRYQYGKNPYYYCSGARLGIDAGCFGGRAYVSDLKDVVLAAVKAEAQKIYVELKRHDKAARKESAAQQELFAEEKRLAAQMGLLERNEILLYEDFVDGKLSKEDYLAAKAACAAELVSVKARAGQIAARKADFASSNRRSDDRPVLERILNATDVNDEVLALIDCVTVYAPERIEIRFDFSDMYRQEL